jgi:hypothetical protein
MAMGDPAVATLTRLDRKAIAFKKVFEERPFLDLFQLGASAAVLIPGTGAGRLSGTRLGS